MSKKEEPEMSQVEEQQKRRTVREQFIDARDDLRTMSAVTGVSSFFNPVLFPVNVAVKGASIYADLAKKQEEKKLEEQRQAVIKEQEAMMMQNEHFSQFMNVPEKSHNEPAYALDR